ncbi:polyketide synthase dehydratase domain-containing protein, partial [Streptosporangium sp. NPDC001682]
GLASTGHPLLGAAVGLADSDGVLLTGRLSLASHSWLGDHVVAGSVVVSGSVFVELVVRAADQVGCDAVEELTVDAPLVLGEGGAVAVQVWVGGAQESGRRTVSVYARPAEADDGQPWVRHATGVISTGASPAVSFDVAVWPPAGASVIELDGLYEELAEEGLGYGPAFQGLRAAWRGSDGEIFAEVGLPEQVGGAGAFGLHPALLDAVLHAVSFAGLDAVDRGRVPLSWGEVCLHASGASVLRVRLVRSGGDSVSLVAVDGSGAPVVSAGSVVVRPVPAEWLAVVSAGRGAGRDALFEVEWVAVSGLPVAEPVPVAVLGLDTLGVAGVLRAAGDSAPVHADLLSLVEAGPVPGAVVAQVVSDPAAGVVESAHALTARVLDLLQGWLADDRLADCRLVVVTRGAVAAGDGEAVTDLAAAAVGGLVRSAQSENPGRFVLVDVDVAGGRSVARRDGGDGVELGRSVSVGMQEQSPADASAASATVVVSVLASVLASGEPQVAVRGGEMLVPRLARAAVRGAASDASADVTGDGSGEVGGRVWDPEGTVLITGGTGGLGG